MTPIRCSDQLLSDDSRSDNANPGYIRRMQLAPREHVVANEG
jgi:hypothetical protein